MSMLTFFEFSDANRERCESPKGFNHRLSDWSTSDWLTATVGEIGEAANIIKKLNRSRDGIRGNRVSDEVLRRQLQRELADTFIYLDLMAQSLGINLADAVVETWNDKSAELGYERRLDAV